MQVVPFVGRQGNVICSLFGCVGLFDRKAKVQPVAGNPMEVMIASVIYPKLGSKDPIRALIVQPVTQDHVLIDHDGFECSGSMCTTQAYLKRAYNGLPRMITPGRTPVYHVDNVNARFYNREPHRPVPGSAYISRDDVQQGYRRIAGVPDISELEPWIVDHIRAN